MGTSPHAFRDVGIGSASRRNRRSAAEDAAVRAAIDEPLAKHVD
jgi:hypothetical protein